MAGIIAAAVADDLLIARRPARCAAAGLPMVLGGPALYLLGESLFRLRVAGVASAERLAIGVFLALLAPIASHVSALALSATVTTLPSALAPWALGTGEALRLGVDRGRRGAPLPRRPPCSVPTAVAGGAPTCGAGRATAHARCRL